MLETYENTSHDFKKIHKYIEHLVLEVWCKPDGNFSINKLHPEFIPIVKRVNPKYLKNPIGVIYRICRRLKETDTKQIAKLKSGFIANNAIENLCKGVGTPLLYTQIDVIHPNLKTALKEFFKNLYSEVPKKMAFKRVCGDIGDYYDELVGKKETCPFCGIIDILTPGHSKRDALDHYLPKNSYPFNAVNPDNIAPICFTCNTSYKGTQDPIKHKNGKRRKAFYPFSKHKVKIDINATFKCTNILKLKKEEVELKITNHLYQEEINTWMELFGIEERYSIKLSSEAAKDWLKFYMEFQNNQKTKSKSFSSRMEMLMESPLVNNNFLRVVYFEACRQRKILS